MDGMILKLCLEKEFVLKGFTDHRPPTPDTRLPPPDRRPRAFGPYSSAGWITVGNTATFFDHWNFVKLRQTGRSKIERSVIEHFSGNFVKQKAEFKCIFWMLLVTGCKFQ